MQMLSLIRGQALQSCIAMNCGYAALQGLTPSDVPVKKPAGGRFCPVGCRTKLSV